MCRQSSKAFFKKKYFKAITEMGLSVHLLRGRRDRVSPYCAGGSSPPRAQGQSGQRKQRAQAARPPAGEQRSVLRRSREEFLWLKET